MTDRTIGLASTVRAESSWSSVGAPTPSLLFVGARTACLLRLEVLLPRGNAGACGHNLVEACLSARTVKADIEAVLQRITAADADKITVSVEGTDVTLSGTVRSWAEREAVADAVWAAPGVAGVVDEMRLAT